MNDKPKGPATLSVNALHHTAEYDRLVYQVMLPAGVTLEEALLPIFLGAHHSDKLKRGDLVDLVSPDYELDAQLRVIAVEHTLVTTRIRFVSSAREIDASALEEPEVDGSNVDDLELPDGYEVRSVPQGWYVKLTTTTPPLMIDSKLETKRVAYGAAIAHAEAAKGT